MKHYFLLFFVFLNLWHTTCNVMDDGVCEDELQLAESTCDNEPEALSVSSMSPYVVETLCAPASRVKPGQLVIVKGRHDQWQQAVVQEDDELSHQSDIVRIRVNNSNISRLVSLSALRVLRNAFRWKWQPKPPKEYLYATLCDFMSKHVKSNANPFIESQVIPRKSTIIAIGDLHGSIESLDSHIDRLFLKNIFDDDGKIDPKYYIIFLGDYSDRGASSAHVWNRLMELKLANPERIFLVRGNHETLALADYFTFFSEWQSYFTYGIEQDAQRTLLTYLFESLPQVVLLGVPLKSRTDAGQNYKYLMFCHGGIEPTVSLDPSIRKSIMAYKNNNFTQSCRYYFTHHASDSTGFLWSDFYANYSLGDPPRSKDSVRGEKLKTYNSSAAWEYLERFYSNNPKHRYTLNAIFRGHQHVQGSVARLCNKFSNRYRSDWQRLSDLVKVPFTCPSVFTLNSSPEGLGNYGCHEDASVFITCSKEGVWTVEPHINFRCVTVPEFILE